MARGRSRRTFLRELAAGAALLPTGLSGASTGLDRSGETATRLPAGTPRDEADWEAVRARFEFREERVPMNAANLCPSPQAVAEEVSRWTRDIDVDCSFQNRAKYADLLETSRRGVAEMLGVDPDEVALVRNTSEANNTINAGIPLGPGDEVVLWEQNHPTNNVAWDVRAARFGATV
ncbi:MAG TPA: aminotransferase class V-fold PLP-dependent enzyme, partial [Longimicrobiales bacterium]|nr:aminotransferase class V-fold PLP-dependent enzyme [Longimicrobiales bacterium]